ncbi:MAG: hypothetical protein ACOYLQ_14305 [Hyphomicrobiaceae bacterium]
MSAPNDGSGKGPPQPDAGSASKKPTALLDLTATEVKSDPPRAGDASAKAPGPATAVPAAGSAKPAAPGAPSGDPKAADPRKPEVRAAAAPAAGPVPAGASKAGGSTTAAPSAPGRTSSASLATVATHAVAGLVGGLLVLIAADTVGQQLGLDGQSRRPAEADGINRRVSEMEQRFAQIGAASDQAAIVGRALAVAEKRIATLEQTAGRVAALEAQNAKLADDAKVLRDALATAKAGEDPRVAKLQEQLAALAAAAGTDPERGRIPQLAAITGKVADLETTIANQLGQVRKTLGQEIDQRLAPVAEASEAARAGAQRLDREVAGIKSEAVRLAQRADAGKAVDDRTEQTLRGIEQQAAALKVAIDGLKNDVASELKSVARPADVAGVVSPVSQRVEQLEASLKGVVRSEEERRASAEKIVLSLELGNLKRAIDRGRGYAAELADVLKLAGNKLPLAPLARYKDTGVATTADLAAELRTLAHTMLDAQSAPAEASIVDRLMSGAKSIVRVRKVSHDADDKSPEAVVARMDDAAKDGRFGVVLQEAKQLGERAQAVARPWLEKVEARHAVDTAIADIEKQLKASIGAGPAPAKGVN